MPGFFDKQFYGQTLVNPGVYIKRNEQGGLLPPDPNELIPLIIGDSLGGAPGIIHEFRSASQASAVLRGGDLLTAVLAAFQPRTTGPGPDTILAIRIGDGVDAPTQAAHTFNDSGTNPVLIVKSIDYGQYTNGMALAIESSAVANAGYKIILSQDGTAAGKRFANPKDPVGRQGIKVRYLGSGTTCAVTITRTHLTTTCTGASGDNLNIDLTATATNTLDKLVSIINGTGGGTKYAADVVDVAPNRPSNQQDLLSAIDIFSSMTVSYTGAGLSSTLSVTIGASDTTLTTTAGTVTADQLSIAFSGLRTIQDLAAAIAGTATNVVGSGILTYTGAKYTVVLQTSFKDLPVANVPATTTPINILTGGKLPAFFQTTQHLQAVVDFLNVQLSAYVTASLVADAGGVTVGALRLATVPTTYLTGGANATVNGPSWAAGLTLAEVAHCQIVVLLSPDIDDHMALKAHCALMSSPKRRRERVGICGGAAGESLQEAIDRAYALGINFDGDYIQLVWPGVIRVDPITETKVSYAPWMFAAMKAGLSAALGAGRSSTNKILDIIGLETDVSQDDLELLIDGGVCAVVKLDSGVRKGFIVAKDIMTYQEDANFIKSFFMTRMNALISARRVRESLEPLVGEPNNKSLEQRAAVIVRTELNHQVDDEILVASGSDGGWANLIVNQTADTITIEYNARLTTEADFFLITANFTVIGGAV